ncbi:MAG: exodeoxyribonuclease VII small subunit [Clostridiales bacterium]|nr:exodeoxyribonuclease VII small subunit [Clostridiales bacterium]
MLENKLKELETISDKLDEKDVSLEDGIRLFEQGVDVIRECLTDLEQSKGRISVIRGELEELLRESEGEND